MLKRVFIFVSVCLLALSTVEGQLISPEQFRNQELISRYDYYQNLDERLNRSLLLDQSDYDVRYYCLHLDITDIPNKIITGNVTTLSEVMVNAVSEIVYDFKDSMTVDSILTGEQILSFSHSDDAVTIVLDRIYNTGEYISTTVFFHGHPGDDERTFVWDELEGAPVVTTHSFTSGTSEWWPCKDTPADKADSADVFITVADSLTATSNGLLISNVDNGDGTRTFHWNLYYPIAAYLLAVAVSEYVSFKDWYVNAEGDSMPIVNYVCDWHLDDAMDDLEIAVDALEVFSELFGEYPFFEEKYGHTIWTWGGAMEHQCNTFYSDLLITGNHTYDWIAVHEASHMWFGDMITCGTWPDIWMNEGFATYCEALFYEQVNGPSSYRYYMNYTNSVSDPSGPIYDPDELLDGNTVYNKGSWVLHMLRGVMGDTTFFEAMYDYANDPRYMYNTITTAEFQAFMEGYYPGDDLSWFFDQWLLGMNRPWYACSWMTEDIGNGQYEVFLHIQQVQTDPALEVFIMPIQLYWRVNDEYIPITVFNDSSEDDFRFILDGNPTSLQFDPYNWILKLYSQQSYGLNIITTEFPDGNVNSYYDAIIESRGGEEPYTYQVVDGELPSGLTLNEETGLVTGTPTTEAEYTFTIECTDNNDDTDDQEYMVTIGEPVGIDDITVAPASFELIGNYPNPFNAVTSISFRLPSSGYVKLIVYNILGQQVASIHEGNLSAGLHTFYWNAGDSPSGVYLYKLSMGSSSQVMKMTLMK